MVDVPPGVLQRIDIPGGMFFFTQVQPMDWHLFCSQSEAESLLATLKKTFPSYTFKDVYEDGEAAARFLYTIPGCPRVYVIDGLTDLQQPFSEWAGDILTREIKPDSGIDQGGPYGPNSNLKMNFYQYNGFAEFYWSK